MSFEDFTGYTEVDALGRLSQTAARSTFTGITVGDTATYLYKDFGAAEIDDFVMYFETLISASGTDTLPVCMLVTVNSDLEDWEANRTANKTQFGVEFATVGATRLMFAVKTESGTQTNGATITISLSTTYYCTVEKNGTALTLKIYSNSARTTQVGSTSSITLGSDVTSRYIMTPQSFDSAGANAGTGYVQNVMMVDYDITEDGRFIITNILDDTAITKSDGITAATTIHLYDGGPETLKSLVAAYDAVFIYADRDGTSSRWVQDVPVYDTHVYPVKVYSIDQTDTFAEDIQRKCHAQVHSLVEAAAQGTQYSIRVTREADNSRDRAAYDIWETVYSVEYKRSQ